MTQNKSLENRILRDRIAEFGLAVGTAGGFLYGLATRDNEGASMINSIAIGAIGVTGSFYCIATIAKLIYETIKKG